MCSSTVRLVLISSLGLLVRFLFWLLCPGSSCLQTRWLVIVMVIGYVWLTVLQWMTLVSLPFSHFLVSYPTQQPGLCSALLTMGGFSDCDFFPVFLMISVVFCSDGVRNSPVTCASAGVVSLAQLHTIPHQMSWCGVSGVGQHQSWVLLSVHAEAAASGGAVRGSRAGDTVGGGGACAVVGVATVTVCRGSSS